MKRILEGLLGKSYGLLGFLRIFVNIENSQAIVSCEYHDMIVIKRARMECNLYSKFMTDSHKTYF